MARPEPRVNFTARQQAILQRATNAAIVQTASASAAATAEIDAAVSGDLIDASPTLKARLDDLQSQIDDLATP